MEQTRNLRFAVAFAVLLSLLFVAICRIPAQTAIPRNASNSEIDELTGGFDIFPAGYTLRPAATEEDFYWASVPIDKAGEIVELDGRKAVKLTAPGSPDAVAFGSCFNQFRFTKGLYTIMVDYKAGEFCAFSQVSIVGQNFEAAIWNLTDPAILDKTEALADGWRRLTVTVNLSDIRAEKSDSFRLLVGRAEAGDPLHSVMYFDNVRIYRGDPPAPVKAQPAPNPILPYVAPIVLGCLFVLTAAGMGIYLLRAKKTIK